MKIEGNVCLDEYYDKPMSKYSCYLGERLSKDTREKLVKLGIRGFHEYSDKPLSEKSRGQPKCAETLLAEAVGVTYRTVARWVSVGGVKACDVNSDRLAEIAFNYYPEETADILRSDAAEYGRVVELWLAKAGNTLTGACQSIN